MSAQISPQPVAVGENLKPETTTSKVKPLYASIFQANQTASSKIELCAVNFESEHPVIQFSMEDVNIFTREEGLHQAVVIKFSYGKPDVSEVRRIFSLQFDIKGHCNVGQLEYRHLLVRFDLFDDYARFLGKSTGYLKSKSEEFFFRTFPWSFGFNPKEETPMAVVWISLPGLPPNLFARRSLLSIASAVGKPIAVDKATQDKTRPSTARVKVILNLLDNHPKKVLLQFTDSKSGKSVEFHQIIVYDNLPSYGNFCKHQGHVERACRYKDAPNDNKLATNSKASGHIIEKLKGDARDFLNGKRAAQTKVVNNNQQANLVWKQKVEPKKVQSIGTESLTVDPILKEGNKTEFPVTILEDERNVSNLEGDETIYLNANKVDCRPNVQHVGQSKALPSANKTGKSTAKLKVTAEKDSGDLTGNGILSNTEPTQNDAFDPLFVAAGVSDSSKKIQDNASLKLICMTDFAKSISNSTHEKGSVSGVKGVIAQQILVDSGDLDAAADQISDTSLEGSRDIADLSEDKMNQIVEDCEDSTERHATVPLNAADNAEFDQFSAQIGDRTSAIESSITSDILPCLNADTVQPSLRQFDNALTDNTRNTVHSENDAVHALVMAGQNEDNAQPTLLKSTIPLRQNGHDLIDHHLLKKSQILDEPTGKKHQLSQTDKAVIESKHSAVHTVPISAEGTPADNNQYVQIGHVHGSEGNMQNQGHAAAESENQKSNGKSQELTKQQMSGQNNGMFAQRTGNNMDVLDKNHTENRLYQPVLKQSKQIAEENSDLILSSKSSAMVAGGKIQTVKSYPIIPYTYIEQKDHEVFSIFNGQNKPSVLANRKELVIKLKLWDQRRCDDEEGWEEGSTGFSSSEEEDDEDNSLAELFSQEKNAIVIGKAKTTYGPNSSRLLNHNAPAYNPKLQLVGESSIDGNNSVQQNSGGKQITPIHTEQREVQYESSALQISSEQHTFEEGEEEEMLMQCRKDVARKGDLSPMHSKTNKKGRQRDRSWDFRVFPQ